MASVEDEGPLRVLPYSCDDTVTIAMSLLLLRSKKDIVQGHIGPPFQTAMPWELSTSQWLCRLPSKAKTAGQGAPSWCCRRDAWTPSGRALPRQLEEARLGKDACLGDGRSWLGMVTQWFRAQEAGQLPLPETL